MHFYLIRSDDVSRCKHLVQNNNVYLADGKTHTTFACNNKKCKEYLRFSVGKASICINCISHTKP